MIAFISDIHGNTEALSVVLDDIRQHGARTIYCLGDVIGYGAQPRECLLTIMERCELSLLGNHEHGAMYDGTAADFNPRARAAIEWTKKQLSSPQYAKQENYRLWEYIDQMKESWRMDGMLLVHGSPRDPVREYMLPRDAQDAKKMGECYALMKEPLCFVGHSHVPGIYLEGEGFLSPSQLNDEWVTDPARKAIVNIGSVGQPRDGDVRSSYVLFDDGRVIFRRLDYDVAAAQARIRAVPELPGYLADRLGVGR